MKIKGKAYWAKIRTPETYNGQPVGFSMQVLMPDENLAKMKDYFEAKCQEEFAGKKMLGDITMPIKTTDAGLEMVKVKTKHVYKDKATGVEKPKVIPVYNGYGELIPEDVLIGNGSDVEVVVNPKLFYESTNKWGVRLYLQCLMVTNLVKYSKDGSDELTFKKRDANDETETTLDDEVDF